MDVLADLLNGVRANGALLNRTTLTPPWSLRIADESPLALVAVAQGHAWIVPDEGDPVRVDSGDAAIVCQSVPYTVADDPETPPDVVILPDGRFEAPDGRDITDSVRADLLNRNGTAVGKTILICGTYQARGDVNRRLLDALPRVLAVRSEQAGSWLSERVGDEIIGDEPGRRVVLDRLLDVALIMALRAWFSQPHSHAPGWYRAQNDPVVGRGLRSIHERPSHPWTVAGLAATAGASRAWFARRFTELLGEPPMSYLANWRLSLAADRLRETDATIQAIAREVGYSNAFTFSTAFYRVKGIRPSQYRTAGNGSTAPTTQTSE